MCADPASLHTSVLDTMQEIFAIDPDEKGGEEGSCCGRMQPVLLKGWQRMPWYDPAAVLKLSSLQLQNAPVATNWAPP